MGPTSTMPLVMSLLTTPLLLIPTFMTPPATLPLPTFMRSPSLPPPPSPPLPSPTPPTPTTMLTPTPSLPTTLAVSTTLAAWCPAPKSFKIETKRPTEDRKGQRTTREQELDIGGRSVGPTVLVGPLVSAQDLDN